MAKKGKMLILSNPVVGKESEFNAWYDNIHLGEVCNLKGFGGARRYVVDKQLRPPAQAPTFTSVAIYDLDDVDMALAQMAAESGKAPDLDPIDMSRTMSCIMEEIFSYEK